MAVWTQSFKSSWNHTKKGQLYYFTNVTLCIVCALSYIHTICLSRAQLTGKSPAFSRHLAAAALGLGGVEGFGHGAFACFKFGETEALSGICHKRKIQDLEFCCLTMKDKSLLHPLSVGFNL